VRQWPKISIFAPAGKTMLWVEQEAQLMLTTGSTRLLAVSRARDGVP